jgi:hypothetical protein
LTFATIYSQRAYDREKAKSQEALAHHERADASFRQARRAVEEFSRISEEELAGLPYAENLRKRLLEVSLSYYQDFLQQRVNDPEVRLDLAQTRDRIQQLLADLAVMNGAGRHLLLGSPAVHADLRLTESQRNQARVFLDQIIYQRNTEPRDARQMVLEIKRHEAELATFLSKDQIQRLGQIFLQLRGILAFRDSEVLAELKLTPDQKEKLRSIEQEAFITDLSMMAKVGGPPDGRRGGPGPGGPPGRGPKFPPGKQPIDTILNLLTPDQLARWEALVGPEFLGPRGPYGAYGGGPFGGPHRGGPPRKGDRDDN